MRRVLAAVGLALLLSACSRPSPPPADAPVAPVATSEPGGTAPSETAPGAPPASGDSNAELGRLNREFSELLAQAIRSPALTPTTRGQLMDGQVAFARRRAACGPSPAGDACQIAAYNARIAELRAYVPNVN
jgi:hypothetical protein